MRPLLEGPEKQFSPQLPRMSHLPNQNLKSKRVDCDDPHARRRSARKASNTQGMPQALNDMKRNGVKNTDRLITQLAGIHQPHSSL